MKMIVAVLSVVGLALLGSGCVTGATGDDEQTVSEEQALSEEPAVSEEGPVASVSEPYRSCRKVCYWRWGRQYCRSVCSGGWGGPRCGPWGCRRW